MEVKTVPLWFQCSYISISDGDTLGLDGGLTGHAAASLLQWHLPVCESGSLGTSGPRGSRPVPIRGCHTVCCHVHGCHQVGQLALVLRVRLGPAGGVGTHGSGFLLGHSQLKAPGGWKNKRRHHCAERQKIRDNRQSLILLILKETMYNSFCFFISQNGCTCIFLYVIIGVLWFPLIIWHILIKKVFQIYLYMWQVSTNTANHYKAAVFLPNKH